MDRNDKIRACIDPATQVGLEIGPLNNPTIRSSEGSIRYVDHLHTDKLREKYADDPNVDVREIVDVDYVWGEKTLREAIGEGVFFDYVVASHVIEHIPDIIGWFREIAEILKPGGILSLVVPDKRYTFDCQRGVSRPAELIEAFLLKRRKPSIRQVFDSHYSSAPVDSSLAWSDSFDPTMLQRVHHHPIGVFNLCREIVEKQLYMDSHCYTFTPESFIENLEVIFQLSLVDFKLEYLSETEKNGMEFYVSLKKLPG